MLAAIGQIGPVQGSVARGAFGELRRLPAFEVAAAGCEDRSQGGGACFAAQREAVPQQLGRVEQQHAQDALVLSQHEARWPVHRLARARPGMDIAVPAAFQAPADHDLHVRRAACFRVGRHEHVQQPMDDLRRVLLAHRGLGQRPARAFQPVPELAWQGSRARIESLEGAYSLARSRRRGVPRYVGRALQGTQEHRGHVLAVHPHRTAAQPVDLLAGLARDQPHVHIVRLRA